MSLASLSPRNIVENKTEAKSSVKWLGEPLRIL